MYILLVEDDDHIGASLQQALINQGYSCDWVQTQALAESALEMSQYHLAIFDWMLPDGSGTNLLKMLRAQGSDLPILMLTARTATTDKVTGLDYGADDYLTKPFDLDELLARVRALGRRQSVAPSRQKIIGDLCIDQDQQRVIIKNKGFELSATEFAVLYALAQRPGRYLSKAQLEQVVYAWDKAVTPNAIEAIISRLRKKIGSDRLITLRGVGYALETN